MNASESIITLLQEQGFRITASRRAIIEVVLSTSGPVDAGHIITSLQNQGISVNKTTVYREIAFLQQQGIISKVSLDQRKYFYEIAPSHHHHAVCTNCGVIADVRVSEPIEELEQEIAKVHQFLVTRHSLEFFGLCINCQQI